MRKLQNSLIIALLIVLFQSNKVAAQTRSVNSNSFKIINTAGLKDLSAYEKALSVPDMENFRYRTKRNTVVFDNGVTVELFSAQELFIMGRSILPNDYTDTRDKKYVQPVFHLTDNGSLVAMYTKTLK